MKRKVNSRFIKGLNLKTREMYMEDVGSLASDTCDFLTEKLSEFKTKLSPEQVKDLIENQIWDVIFEKLEEYCDNDYKQQMG
jgi:hypothetical protein